MPSTKLKHPPVIRGACSILSQNPSMDLGTGFMEVLASSSFYSIMEGTLSSQIIAPFDFTDF